MNIVDAKTLSHYRKGRTSIFASRTDQRFSYCCYVPASYEERGQKRYPLTVAVHGSRRNVDGLRDNFVEYAEANQTIVLVPLFPCGIEVGEDLHNYKHILFRGIRYDLILLDMISEIGGIYRLDAERVLLHGFSGGAQFAHRFLMLHPERLLAVSIAAPGSVTLLDETRPWWVGIGDFEKVFAKKLNYEGMRRVAVQLVIGSDDVETWDVTTSEKAPHYMEGANDAGVTRIDRISSLRTSFEAVGINCRFDLMSGVGHEGVKIQPPVFHFFKEVLSRESNSRPSDRGAKK